MSGGHFLLVLFFIDPSLAWFCHISGKRGLGECWGASPWLDYFEESTLLGFIDFFTQYRKQHRYTVYRYYSNS